VGLLQRDELARALLPLRIVRWGFPSDLHAVLTKGARGNGEGGSNTGKAHLILGSSLPPASLPVTIDLSSADYSFGGEAPYNYAGDSVSSAGDVDGDGLSDLLVGAYGNADAGWDAGKAYLLLSPF
jgi:hypothetical protein